MKQNLTAKDLRKSGADYNPRTITKPELDRLKKAIEEFGDLGGIVFNRRTGRLVGGHQRVKVIPKDAIIEKTDLSAPSRTGTAAHGFIVIDGEKYSYREVDWDESREKAANIAANAHGGDWDEAKLGELLKELSADVNFDIDLTGFTLAEVYQTIGGDPLHDTADRLMTISDQLRKSREAFKEVQKKLEETDDIMDCYLVVVFKNSEERKKFTDALSLPDNRYVDGRTLQTILTAREQERAE
jgi:ParB-like chromosome segregation protein Spo0J